MTLCAATVLLAACQRAPEQAARAAASEPGAAPEPTQVNPADWAGIKYWIQSVPAEHQGVPHTSLHGSLEIVVKGNEFTLKTQDGPHHKWPDEFKNAVLTFNQGERFCDRPPPPPKALTSAEQKKYAEFIRGTKARRLKSNDVHKLHEESDGHTTHRIWICLIDPKLTGGEKEIAISADQEGGGHDGVSHGVS
jgi:hypothetical protein